MTNLELACLAIAIEHPDLTHILARNADRGLWMGKEAGEIFGTIMGLYEKGERITWPLMFDLLPPKGIRQGLIDKMVNCLTAIPRPHAEDVLKEYLSKLKVNRARGLVLKDIEAQARGVVFDLEYIKGVIANAELESEIHEDPSLGAAYQEYVHWVTAKRSGVFTGFQTFDNLTDKLSFGELISIMGRTTTGKTWVGINTMINIVREEPDLSVGFFSLEMPRSGIIERMLQIEYNQSRWDLKPAVQENPEDFRDLFTSRFPNVSIYGGIYSAEEIKILARRGGHKVIFVDFLGLVRARDERGSPYAQATQKITEFKQLAKDTGSLVVLLVQLSRAGGYGNLPVTIDMCRDSGALEEMSDFIYGIWDPGLDATKAAEWRGRVVMALLKSKRSGLREIKCKFDRRTGRMEEELPALLTMAK